MSETVIRVENLYKEYRLGTISHGTLYMDLQSWWARIRGKEDPNSIVAFHDRLPERDLSAENPHILALNDVSFDVQRGEVLGIIGRNGAGKSTLLKILSEVTSPTKGLIKIRGRVASLLEVGTGFHPELTGKENIYLNGAILGMTKKEIDRKFDEIVDFAEVEKFIDTPVKRYSSGMYVRLAFAVAAHLEPEILIVDEVLAVGDVQFQKKCLGKMGEVSREGRTVLFVSHNMAAIKKLCNSCLVLANGEKVFYGTCGEGITAYSDGLPIHNYRNNKGYCIDEHQLSECRFQGLRINEIAVYNITNPARPFSSKDKIKFRISYETSRNFVSPAFVFIFKDANGIEILRLSTMPISGYKIAGLFQKGYIDLDVESIPLVKGTYYIDVGFVRESVAWHFKLEDIILLNIEAADVYNSGFELDRSRGMIWTPHRWHHEEIT